MIDSQSLEILKYINKNGKTEIENIYSSFGKTDQVDKCIEFLKNKNHIRGLTDKSYIQANPISLEITRIESHVSPYEVTPEGKAYIEKHKSDKSERHFTHFHIWTNTVIALLALLTAISALIVSLMQLLK